MLHSPELPMSHGQAPNPIFTFFIFHFEVITVGWMCKNLNAGNVKRCSSGREDSDRQCWDLGLFFSSEMSIWAFTEGFFSVFRCLPFPLKLTVTFLSV